MVGEHPDDDALDEYRRIIDWWDRTVKEVAQNCAWIYREALSRGVAKEVARALLPEGLVPTRIYVCGSVRSFIHYCKERMTPGVAQQEHVLLAKEVHRAVFDEMPMLKEALRGYLPDPEEVR